jgi:hypothetical protein
VFRRQDTVPFPALTSAFTSLVSSGARLSIFCPKRYAHRQRFRKGCRSSEATLAKRIDGAQRYATADTSYARV